MIRIRFSDAPAVRSASVECVIDSDDFREVKGIEILDLRRQTEEAEVFPSPPRTATLRWAYDDEIDAFSITTGAGMASVQTKAVGQASIGADNDLVAFQVELPF